MSILRTRLKTPAADSTVVPVDITWTTNQPIPSASQTIADGSAVTGAEAGQAIANTQVVLAAILADIQDLRGKLQD